jgi:hypothetical protein
MTSHFSTAGSVLQYRSKKESLGVARRTRYGRWEFRRNQAVPLSKTRSVSGLPVLSWPLLIFEL